MPTRRTPESRVAKPPAFELPRYIAIEGPLRVGKSTLARFLADRMHARRIMDCEDNPFLADFYREKTGSAFRAQMYFLMDRHRRVQKALAAGGTWTADFLSGKDRILANPTRTMRS